MLSARGHAAAVLSRLAIGLYFEAEEKTALRRDFGRIVFHVGGRPPPPQPAALRAPRFVEIKQQRRKLECRVGVDAAIFRLAIAAHRDHRGSVAELEVKLCFHDFSYFRAFQLAEQLGERSAIGWPRPAKTGRACRSWGTLGLPRRLRQGREILASRHIEKVQYEPVPSGMPHNLTQMPHLISGRTSN
jgi:hypothetical protein